MYKIKHIGLIIAGFLLAGTCSVGATTDKVALMFDEADSLLIEMDYKGAEKVYKNILKIEKESFDALVGLARLNVAKRDWGDVKKWSNKILKIDADNLDGHYYLAIANRETGMAKGFFLKNKDYGESEEHFEFIIAKDKTHRDVLYQRGRLESERENWDAALDWGWQQMQVKPALANAQSGLFKLGRLFLRNVDEGDIPEILDQYSGEWQTFFSAELLRSNKQYFSADSMLVSLLENVKSMSRTPVHLSRIKIKAAQGDDDAVNELYWQALEEADSFSDIMFFYEDTKYIFTLDEWRDFRTLVDIDDFKEFFSEMWANRDPIPASPNDYGLIEHYRRFVYAEEEFWFDGKRSKIKDLDAGHWLKFPETYYLNQEFSDKGLVYLRQGPPDDIAKTTAALDNESWLYQGYGERETMVLHFVVSGASAPGDWRLTAILDDPAMLNDRLGWDSSVNNVATSRNYLDYRSNLSEMGRASERAVTQALTTCFYSANR
jgi:tetratricopeptide (TPR) repeat protein